MKENAEKIWQLERIFSQPAKERKNYQSTMISSTSLLQENNPSNFNNSR
jgi:hypothetical protein